MRSSRQCGFTLIELVAVIMLLAISLVGATSFIAWGTLSFVDSAERQRMLEETRFVVERMSRELSSAVQNSVRINSTCLSLPK